MNVDKSVRLLQLAITDGFEKRKETVLNKIATDIYNIEPSKRVLFLRNMSLKEINFSLLKCPLYSKISY